MFREGGGVDGCIIGRWRGRCKSSFRIWGLGRSWNWHSIETRRNKDK